MNARANPPLPGIAGPEFSTAGLLAALDPHAGKALVFSYDGRDVLSGYHVTEVKAGRFASLDCGANPEAWAETFIQLWDVPREPGRAPLSVDTFRAIIAKVAAAVPLVTEARLTFEVSDGVRPMALYQADRLTADGAAVRIGLTPRAASCKPRDRWLAQATPAPCCATAAAPERCCA